MGPIRAIALPAALLAWAIGPAGASGAGDAIGADRDPRCSPCHTCASPTRSDPCLRPCRRHQQAASLSPDLGPDVVILDDLESLYVPVRFDHRAHAQMSAMSGGCETCHHYTPPDSVHPACRDCHPVEIVHEDLAQPGLKGAYHRGCLHCHEEWDRDTACDVCHEKKEGGALHGTATEVCVDSHYAPLDLTELIIFTPADDAAEPVPFHHRRHSRLYERDCTECHQRQRCSRCHIQGGDAPHPMRDSGQSSLHETCYRCHDGQRCDDCHGRDPDAFFNHAQTGWRLERYHASLACRTCHGHGDGYRRLDRACTNCHPSGWSAASFNHRVTGVALDELHTEADCDSCHIDGPGTKARCDGCHDDGRSYSAATGFTAS